MNSSFEFGFELQGRGEVTSQDIAVGILIQPTDVPISWGIVCYILTFVFAVSSCLFHNIVSLNRFVAVTYACKYQQLFSKKNCITIIIAVVLCVSPVGAFFFVCIFVDLGTLIRIVYLRKVRKIIKDKKFDRDIRFFAQTSVQNVIMVVASTFVVIVNNRVNVKFGLRLAAFNLLLISQLTNSLALFVFNPEIRARIRIKISEFRGSSLFGHTATTS
ncbi:hypothetical protein QR680_015981 [Steinernema hermaphroditum]|uniref:7TM GPCR serpentine receptor class x (Srx) domain-containing protein n=1 Tax=Steinernema hermaphroditum TaxID=289476 RepID=A0AA39HBJ3_9BILA|nr:hypothetical protein QR680_015981 [Steinernema hermaphroditum]